MAAEKKSRLSINDKFRILERLAMGEKQVSLSQEYGISQAAISKIRKNGTTIKEAKRKCEEEPGQVLKKKIHYKGNSDCNKALYLWFIQMRSLNFPVSGKTLQDKARILNTSVGGPGDFQASNGWLDKWKQKYEIRQLSIQGGGLSANEQSSKSFCETFQTFVKEHDYHPDNIYNADESGLMWNALPDKTLVLAAEQSAPGRKVPKDRVTLMFCANASGTHKIPLMMIGKTQKPRCFKNAGQLPLIYKGQKSAWMDRKLFVEWYTQIFLPALEEKHGRDSRSILLLDNAPSHPSANELNKLSDLCTVQYLPPNVTALIQPMNQGVIEKTKKLFKKYFLEHILVLNDNAEYTKFLKSWNLQQVCTATALAWNSVTDVNLKNAWKNLLGKEEIFQHEEYLGIDRFVEMARNVRDCDGISTEQVNEWLQDENEPGWGILNDEEIVQLVNGIFPEVTGLDENDEDEEEINNEPLPDDVTPQEALNAVMTFKKYLESQCDSNIEDIYTLAKFAVPVRQLVLSEKLDKRLSGQCSDVSQE